MLVTNVMSILSLKWENNKELRLIQLMLMDLTAMFARKHLLQMILHGHVLLASMIFVLVVQLLIKNEIFYSPYGNF